MKKIFLFFAILSLLATPNLALAQVFFDDPYQNKLWYMDAIHAGEAWEYSQGEEVVVALLDSGFDISHPDLIQNIYVNKREILGDGVDNDRNGYVDDFRGWDFVNDDYDVKFDVTKECLTPAGECSIDAVHHGTLIAGIIGAQANNGIGITGIAPKVKILPMKVLDTDGAGSSEDVILAIEYAIASGAKVINMSFVGRGNDDFLDAAIENAYKRGVAVVLAAGNAENGVDGVNLSEDPRYPVCADANKSQQYQLGVGALNALYNLSFFSNYGSCVDITAPGQAIFGLQLRDDAAGLTDSYAEGYRGTSLSAPMVTSAIALLSAKYPKLTVSQKYGLIMSSAKDISAENPELAAEIGYGALDLQQMFVMAEAMYGDGSKVLPEGRLIKSSAGSTVYYLTPEGGRKVFPDVGTYNSWLKGNFNRIETLTPEAIAQYPLVGVMQYQPYSRLIKITSIPEVYAIGEGGVLTHIPDEETARDLYGEKWASMVSDVSDSLFFSYSF